MKNNIEIKEKKKHKQIKNTNIIKRKLFFGIFFLVPMKSTNIRKCFVKYISIYIYIYIYFFQPSFTHIKLKETNLRHTGKQRQKKKKKKILTIEKLNEIY
jgi:hypothetical protein